MSITKMKQVLGFLNPMNVVNKVLAERSLQENDSNIIWINYTGNTMQLTFDRYDGKIESEPYDNQDLQLSDLEDIQLIHYDLLKEFNEKESHFIEYIVLQDDTLQGMALKFNLDPKKILEVNSFSDEYMIKIKIPATQNIAQSILSIDPATQVPSYFGRNFMDEIMLKDGGTKKYQVSYLTDIGNILGSLTVNQDIILFDPALTEYNKNLTVNKQESNISKFQLCVQLRDIQAVHPIILPTRMSQIGQQCFRDYIIQIVIHSLGKSTKKEAFIYFRLMEGQELQNEAIMSLWISQICSTITCSTHSQDEQDGENLTLVPFFDLKSESEEEMIRMLITRANKIWGGSSIIPKMLGESSTITIDQFIQIVSHIPYVFKTGNWRLIYQNHRDGSSINTMLMNCYQQSPLIIVIRDLDGMVFGAYLSEELRTELNKFYGSGETFLFTFKNEQQIRTYHWSNLNQDFIYCDHEGFGVGCGDKYGLFVSGDLAHGYSTKCDTFENEILSAKQDFQIDLFEVWSLE